MISKDRFGQGFEIKKREKSADLTTTKFGALSFRNESEPLSPAQQTMTQERRRWPERNYGSPGGRGGRVEGMEGRRSKTKKPRH